MILFQAEIHFGRVALATSKFDGYTVPRRADVGFYRQLQRRDVG